MSNEKQISPRPTFFGAKHFSRTKTACGKYIIEATPENNMVRFFYAERSKNHPGLRGAELFGDRPTRGIK